MNFFRRFAGWQVTLFLLGAMLTQPTANDLNLDLPAAIQGVEESPVVMRIGVVTNLVESDNITVRISGSNVLVQASYLFPAYQPILGDRVVVYRQDSQWLVAGTMSGPINTAILNPSFEEGVPGALPSDWTFTVVSSAGGVPTFTKVLSGDIAGQWIGRVVNSSGGVAGTSTADLFSSRAAASPGQRWAHGFYMTHAYINFNAANVPQGGNTTVETFIQFLDIDGNLLVETSVGFLTLMTNVLNEIYNRTLTTTGGFFVTAPPETAFARLRIRFTLVMNANSATAIGLDYMVLRTPDV